LSVFDYVESTLEPNPVVEYSSLKKVSVSGGSEGEVLENTKKTRDGYGAWSCDAPSPPGSLDKVSVLQVGAQEFLWLLAAVGQRLRLARRSASFSADSIQLPASPRDAPSLLPSHLLQFLPSLFLAPK
jgi:hypothetical protein